MPPFGPRLPGVYRYLWLSHAHSTLTSSPHLWDSADFEGPSPEFVELNEPVPEMTNCSKAGQVGTRVSKWCSQGAKSKEAPTLGPIHSPENECLQRTPQAAWLGSLHSWPWGNGKGKNVNCQEPTIQRQCVISSIPQSDPIKEVLTPSFETGRNCALCLAEGSRANVNQGRTHSAGPPNTEVLALCSSRSQLWGELAVGAPLTWGESPLTTLRRAGAAPPGPLNPDSLGLPGAWGALCSPLSPGDSEAPPGGEAPVSAPGSSSVLRVRKSPLRSALTQACNPKPSLHTQASAETLCTAFLPGAVQASKLRGSGGTQGCCSVLVCVDSLWPHGLQHARLSCLSLFPRVCSNSGPLSQWCHPPMSSSGVSFSSSRPPGERQFYLLLQAAGAARGTAWHYQDTAPT